MHSNIEVKKEENKTKIMRFGQGMKKLHKVATIEPCGEEFCSVVTTTGPCGEEFCSVVVTTTHCFQNFAVWLRPQNPMGKNFGVWSRPQHPVGRILQCGRDHNTLCEAFCCVITTTIFHGCDYYPKI